MFDQAASIESVTNWSYKLAFSLIRTSLTFRSPIRGWICKAQFSRRLFSPWLHPPETCMGTILGSRTRQALTSPIFGLGMDLRGSRAWPLGYIGFEPNETPIKRFQGRWEFMRPVFVLRRWLLPLALTLLAGCGGSSSSTGPTGPKQVSVPNVAGETQAAVVDRPHECRPRVGDGDHPIQ